MEDYHTKSIYQPRDAYSAEDGRENVHLLFRLQPLQRDQLKCVNLENKMKLDRVAIRYCFPKRKRSNTTYSRMRPGGLPVNVLLLHDPSRGVTKRDPQLAWMWWIVTRNCANLKFQSLPQMKVQSNPS